MISKCCNAPITHRKDYETGKDAFFCTFCKSITNFKSNKDVLPNNNRRPTPKEDKEKEAV